MEGEEKLGVIFNNASAIFKSIGVVILMFSGLPSIRLIFSPADSTTVASSVNLF
jgi:hypothetical protein